MRLQLRWLVTAATRWLVQMVLTQVRTERQQRSASAESDGSAELLSREPETLRAGDRMGAMAFLSIIVHTMIILGVGFAATRPDLMAPPLIEVTLSSDPAERTPDDYDFIAPDDQDGGGTLDEIQVPGQQAALLADPRDQEALLHERPTPERRQDSQQQTPLIATEQSDDQRLSDQQHSPLDNAPRHDRDQVTPTPELAAMDVTDPSQQIDWNARYPSRARIDARTRQHAAAAYMHGWVQQLEQVGNLNYPEAVRERGLSGRLIIETTLRSDGQVENVRILRGSEHSLLDEAAIYVVRMAGPFQQVPPEVLEGKDQLVITRTLEFMHGGRLETSGGQ